MLTFIHLSDLHFSAANAGTQFDLDIEIREKILQDLRTRPLGAVNGVLVSGDIAFGGLKTEYDRANEWFELLRKQLDLPPESVHFIPGNHDVDRKHLAPGSMLWDSHSALRSISDSNRRALSLQTKLEEPALDFLLPLKEYRDFSAQHGRLSVTAAGQLAWETEVTERLDDGTPLVLHGLNSTLISNKADIRANLLVSPFQFVRLARRQEVINLVMCHHPPSWLLDGNEVEDRYHRHAHIVLTGHEHQSRCYASGPGIRVCAGAVHPSRGEAEWNPGYNILRVAIETTPERVLVTRVESRVWHKTNFVFVASESSNGSNEFVHRQPLSQRPHLTPNAVVVAPAQTTAHIQQPTVNPAPPNGNADYEAARRRLIVHFMALGIFDRLKAAVDAGVWEDSDDAFEGQSKWARVFERAQERDRLNALWQSVAKLNQNLAQYSNPFIK